MLIKVKKEEKAAEDVSIGAAAATPSFGDGIRRFAELPGSRGA